MRKFYYDILSRLENSDRSFQTIYELAFGFSDNVMFESSKNMMIDTVTYARCERIAKSIAFNLQARSFDYGSRIGICMKNSSLWASAFFGILMAGYIPLLLNEAAPAAIRESCIRAAGAAAVITDKPGADSICIDELTGEGEPEVRFSDEIILCTSGTMGEPKLCAYSGKEISAQLLTAAEIIKKTPQIKNYYDETLKSMKILTLLPFCHIYGLVSNLLWFSVFGQCFVELNKLDPKTITNTCRLHGVTHIFAPPVLWNTLYRSILSTAEKQGLDKKLRKGIRLVNAVSELSPGLGRKLALKLFGEVHAQAFGTEIRYCITGGGSISGEVLELINGIGYFLTQGYGMTEIGIASLVLSQKPSILSSGSVGFPLSSCEYRINEKGILEVRGASCFIAYYKDGKRFERDNGEWFETGDIFTCNDKGYFFSCRADDVINGSNGERISPDDIELHFKSELIKNICVFGENTGGADSIVLVAEPSGYRADIIKRISDELLTVNAALPSAMRANSILISRSPLPVSLNAKVSRNAVKKGLSDGTIITVSASDSVKRELTEVMNEAKAELLRSVINCFAEATGKDASGISGSTSFLYDLSGNSMEYLTLLDLIENETGVKVDGALAFSTPEEFADYILEAGIS